MSFKQDTLYSTMSNINLKQDDEVNPYNEKNKLITVKDIKNVFKQYFDIDMEPNSMTEYIKAFTHSSYTENKYYEINIKEGNIDNTLVPLQKNSSERLEFLGDTVMKAIIAGYLYKRYPDEDEGFMTSLKTQIEDRSSYAKLSAALGFGEFLLISKQTELTMGRITPKLLEDCFEAFMGATYLDQGFEICRKSIWMILETQIPYSDYLYKCHDYKGKMQNEFHAMKWLHSKKYDDIECKDIDGKKQFKIGIIDNKGHIIQEGIGASKKEAEQNASMLLLYNWGIIKEDQMK